MKFANTKGWRTFMSRMYGWGASVVILGALFKIMHWPYADFMLILGMGTEVLVFFFSAFENQAEEPAWEKVYPELSPDFNGELPSRSHTPTQVQGLTLSTNLDQLLEKADIGPELINNLGRGLRNLSENVARLADMSNAALATKTYSDNLESASRSVSELNQAYKQTAETLKKDLGVTRDFSVRLNEVVGTLGELNENYKKSAFESSTYGDQLKKTVQNLSSLNASYEMQLRNASNQAEATGKMKESVDKLVSNLDQSVDHTRKYQQEMDQLTANIKALNSVYGNMLSAMNFNVSR